MNELVNIWNSLLSAMCCLIQTGNRTLHTIIKFESGCGYSYKNDVVVQESKCLHIALEIETRQLQSSLIAKFGIIFVSKRIRSMGENVNQKIIHGFRLSRNLQSMNMNNLNKSQKSERQVLRFASQFRQEQTIGTFGKKFKRRQQRYVSTVILMLLIIISIPVFSQYFFCNEINVQHEKEPHRN